MKEGAPGTPNGSERTNLGAQPILAWVGQPKDFEKKKKQKQFICYRNRGVFNGIDFWDKYEADNIDYKALPSNLEAQGILNAGEHTYVISKVDRHNKFSEGYYMCTGLVVAGTEKQTGKNISFLSHQDPWSFLHDDDVNQKFVAHLTKQLAELKDRSIPGSIDAVIVGGTSDIGEQTVKEESTDSTGRHLFIRTYETYTESIRLLEEQVERALGFKPVTINGPKTSTGQDRVYFDNEHRRLYFVRPSVNKDTKDFEPGQIDAEKGKWR